MIHGKCQSCGKQAELSEVDSGQWLCAVCRAELQAGAAPPVVPPAAPPRPPGGRSPSSQSSAQIFGALGTLCFIAAGLWLVFGPAGTGRFMSDNAIGAAANALESMGSGLAAATFAVLGAIFWAVSALCMAACGIQNRLERLIDEMRDGR